MKKYSIKYILSLFILQLFWACSPDEYSVIDNENPTVDIVAKAEMILNHTLLIADGKAEIDIRPLLYTTEGFKIIDSRIKEEWLEYTTADGMKLTRHFSTDDAELIGKTLTVKLKIKGKDIKSSKAVSFKVIAPTPNYEELVVPVVFHIIQTTKDLESLGGVFPKERIDILINKLNAVFSGSVSQNPVGVNNRVTFKLAEYNPVGAQIAEKGINRLVVKEIPYDGTLGYSPFFEQNKLVWPADKYLNIWLVSSIDETNGPNFERMVYPRFVPGFVKSTVAQSSYLQGIALIPGDDLESMPTDNKGFVFKLQSLNYSSLADMDYSSENDVLCGLGTYFGLLTTSAYSPHIPAIDYCDDTMKYYKYDENFNSTGNDGESYKSANGCYFLSENIMDDKAGLHRSITQGQCQRIRWVLENCPTRAYWKSQFAFTGK